ncbi:MAG: glutamate-5-semialdehyde dehydrogenase [Anaerolineae bacterium]
MNDELQQKGRRAKFAARQLAVLSSKRKNQALQAIAETIMEHEPLILKANDQDLEAGRKAGLSEALLDRLLLTPHRLESIANDVLTVAGLPDPVGEEFDCRVLPNGLRVSRRRVPVGVIGVIYESRPNVTVDISVLCLKSGNAAILRGGKEAAHSNRAFAEAVTAGYRTAGLPDYTIQLIETPERSLVREILRASEFIDMIIPRGGAALHQYAIENATIPVITGGIGICHIYIDAQADRRKVAPIVVNAKVQRPSVCNALDTILVHQAVAPQILPLVADALHNEGVELRCEPRALAILEDHPAARPAGPQDFDTEFLSLVAAVKVVDDLDQALDHIYEHSTRHSDAILTENYSLATRFVNEVDSAAVFVNASTRFNDGAQFGLGAEVAVSTQRLHARGPMGLQELTTYKWVVLGDGQIRE